MAKILFQLFIFNHVFYFHLYIVLIGISKDMFFVNHCEIENAVQETKSRFNIHEAEFIVELCRYIILQGYKTSQVTILTTYSGQLRKITDLMKDEPLLIGVHTAVVDKYQGKENEIILLSFVRSNEEGDIGFLNDLHRVNVALSRAKCGLYCVGNFKCLAENNRLWQKIMSHLEEHQATGTALEIYCQNHKNKKQLVSSKDDFNGAPDGGCKDSCRVRLHCGHRCRSACHIVDIEHKDQFGKCNVKCNKEVCESNHRCEKVCHPGDECGKCNVTVEKVRAECQHKVKVACSGNPALVRCPHPCRKNLKCGHKCRLLCSELCHGETCNEQVQREAPCGHKVFVKCSNAIDPLKLLDACTELCRIKLKCGHSCEGSCGRCRLGRLHIA